MPHFHKALELSPSSRPSRTYGGPWPRITVRIGTALWILLGGASILRPGLLSISAHLIRECARVGLCCVSLGQRYPFRGSTGAPRHRLSTPNLLEQRKTRFREVLTVFSGLSGALLW